MLVSCGRNELFLFTEPAGEYACLSTVEVENGVKGQKSCSSLPVSLLQAGGRRPAPLPGTLACASLLCFLRAELAIRISSLPTVYLLLALCHCICSQISAGSHRTQLFALLPCLLLPCEVGVLLCLVVIICSRSTWSDILSTLPPSLFCFVFF